MDGGAGVCPHLHRGTASHRRRGPFYRRSLIRARPDGDTKVLQIRSLPSPALGPLRHSLRWHRYWCPGALDTSALVSRAGGRADNRAGALVLALTLALALAEPRSLALADILALALALALAPALALALALALARMSPSVTPGREVELVANGGSQGCPPMARDVS